MDKLTRRGLLTGAGDLRDLEIAQLGAREAGCLLGGRGRRGERGRERGGGRGGSDGNCYRLVSIRWSPVI